MICQRGVLCEERYNMKTNLLIHSTFKVVAKGYQAAGIWIDLANSVFSIFKYVRGRHTLGCAVKGRLAGISPGNGSCPMVSRVSFAL